METFRRAMALMLLFILLALLSAPAARVEARRNCSCRASAMYVMGDSSVDCGDNTLFHSILHRNLSLYPCNGSAFTLVPYLLAEKMGMGRIQTFYSLNGSVTGLQGSINFGSAQATILHSGSGRSLQSLNEQLRQVMDTFQLLQLQLSVETAKHFIRSLVFYLSFGKDDYTDIYLRNVSGIMVKGREKFAHILVSQMIHTLRGLYQAGVRKMVVMGTMPLGCAPRVMWWYRRNTTDAGGGEIGCVAEVNDLVVGYNNLLEEHIVDFRIKLPDAQIVFCDVYRVILEIVTHPMSYGFDDVQRACCGLGRYGAMVGCISLNNTCNGSSSHVWWDFYNPTFAVNFLLAESAWSGNPIPSICRPLSILQLVSD